MKHSRVRYRALALLPVLGGISACSLLAGSAAHAQTLLASYNFNDTGTTTASSVANGPTLSLSNVVVGASSNTGVAADLHGSAGSGVSGLAGDTALSLADTTSYILSTQTYNGGVAGGALNASSVATQASLANSFNTHTNAFTLQGWFNVASTTAANTTQAPTFNGGTRVWDANGFLVLATGGGVLQLQIGSSAAGNFANSGGYAPTVGQWEYYAITYTGTAGGGEVDFYKGTSSTSVSLINRVTGIVPAGTASNYANTSFTIGDTFSQNRAFFGSLDDTRMFSGALTLNQLEAVRQADAANTSFVLPAAAPEPSSFLLAGMGAGGFILPILRRRIRARRAA